MCAFGENHHHVWETKYPRQGSKVSKHLVYWLVRKGQERSKGLFSLE